MAPLPVPAAWIGPSELLLVPFVGSKEEFPGHGLSGPGEDIPEHSAAGSDGRRPEEKWIWDMTYLAGLGLSSCCREEAGDPQELGPHLSSILTDLQGHRSSVVRATVTFIAPNPQHFLMATSWCHCLLGTPGVHPAAGPAAPLALLLVLQASTQVPPPTPLRLLHSTSVPSFCPLLAGTWGWEDSKGDIGAFPSWTWWLWAGNVLLTLPTRSLVASQPGEDVWVLGTYQPAQALCLGAAGLVSTMRDTRPRRNG